MIEKFIFVMAIINAVLSIYNGAYKEKYDAGAYYAAWAILMIVIAR